MAFAFGNGHGFFLLLLQYLGRDLFHRNLFPPRGGRPGLDINDGHYRFLLKGFRG